jgi:hypothetical protein
LKEVENGSISSNSTDRQKENVKQPPSNPRRSSSFQSRLRIEVTEIITEQLPADGRACFQQCNYTQKETVTSWPFWMLVITLACNATGLLHNKLPFKFIDADNCAILQNLKKFIDKI